MKNWLVLLCLSLVFVACEEKEDDEIYSAQVCIDRSTQTTVDDCLAKISSHTSQRAYVLRCAADFIRQGFDTPTIVQAIINVDDNSGNNVDDPTIDFYDQFSFPSKAIADTTVSNCSLSGSKNLLLLALSAQTATVIKVNVLGGTLNAGTISALDPNLVQVQDLTSIGSSVLQLEPIACGTTGALKDTEICDNLSQAKITAEAAVAANNSLNLGEEAAKAFLNLLKTPNNN